MAFEFKKVAIADVKVCGLTKDGSISQFVCCVKQPSFGNMFYEIHVLNKTKVNYLATLNSFDVT